ncbi:Cu2+-exporting ATPase [Capronia epimyces CBS 606.96]|uniref:Cu2+-exporting ATPase n=1 Tax=Capronia epimyces CBS 606.96 TaxID=1182542 RepID=W9Y4K7_9EURO|nr:Cu2+-exporting ATPase [Capronia epimyces CBS 606.96]EXJ87428.1 Cu2+-exporting ATPase [Capronia epimyces CBS 606.96]
MESLQGGPPAHMATTTLKVDGMTCGACTSAVESGFKGVEGAGAVSVSLMMGRAVVHHDPVLLPPEKLAEIIEDRGFDAEVLSTDMPEPAPVVSQQDDSNARTETGSQITATTISIKGMTCGACTSSVEAGFKDVPGVKSLSVSLLAERAIVQHDANQISAEALAEIIEDRGFDATVVESKAQENTKPTTGTGSGDTAAHSTWTTTVAIEGMTCGACTSSIDAAFKNTPGLVRFNISLLAERAVISHDPVALPSEKIVELIEDAGFEAKIISSQAETAVQGSSNTVQQLKIYGLPDGKAATDLETELRSKPGIKNAVISLSTSRATVTYDPAMIGLRMIVGVVETAGFNALVADSEDNNAQLESLAKTKEIQEWRRAFLTSLGFAIPVLLISMVIPMFLPSLDFGAFQIIPGLFLGDVICCALTVPVQFGIGKRFYKSAYKSLKHRSPTMDVLVVLGTSAAFFFSCFAVVVAVLIPPHNKPGTVFDTSTMLVTFITLGRWLENRAKGQTSKALSSLMSLAPSMATIYDDPLYAEKLADAWSVPESPILEKTPSISSRHNSLSGPSGPSAIEKVIPTELIEVGDLVILRPGDKVPADGIVTRGESYVDESMVTGEPMPIFKKKGSALIAGTVNGAGKVDFKVTRAGKDTQLSQIVNLVQEAQTSRAPIQRMADLVAGYFVPVIILLGLITFIGWMVLSHTMPNPPKIFVDGQSGGKFMVCLKLCISVIVFACPCALGLATPTAVMVGTGTASQQGILVKGGAALEEATRITHVLLDKTGTLTFGKLHVADTNIASLWSSNEWRVKLWWTLIGLAEAGSEHPIARSVVAASREKLDLDDEEPFPGQVVTFGVTVGQGVSAIIELENSTAAEQTRYKVYVGNAKFLHGKKIPIPAEFEDDGNPTSALATAAREKSKTGITTVYVAINGQFAGILELSDALKPTAPAAIAALHKMGISTSLVTGDTYNTAFSIARLVGIPSDSIRASVSPGEKQALVAELQSQGEVVAMVGDGINDSPALATANIGIGLVSGSDIAVEAADIVIMRSDDLLNIPAALHLCRVIFRRIKMNLIWACAYNVIGLPFAMGIFLPLGYHMPPLMSATAMMFSSISVTLSSLALRWAGRPRWLTVEAMDAEGAKISVPVVGQKRNLGVVATARDLVSGLFDAALTKRKAAERDRGNYVPLRNVEPV